MIRKTIIVLLTLGAVGLFMAGLVNRSSWRTQWAITDRHTLGLRVEGSRLEASYLLTVDAYDDGERWVWMGFGYDTWALESDSAGIWRYYTVWFPFWALVILLAIYPTLAFACGPLRRHRRRKRGLCVRCGYNLTGLMEPRCPECGTEITPR